MSALDDLNEILTLRKMVYDLRSENERLKEAVAEAREALQVYQSCYVKTLAGNWLSKYGAKDADATKEAGSLEWS